MHEKHLLSELVKKAEQVCREQGALRVTRMHVFLGALSHLTPEHFRDHFEQESRGTPAEGADVTFTLGEDVNDSRAQDVVLLDLEVEDDVPPSAPSY